MFPASQGSSPSARRLNAFERLTGPRSLHGLPHCTDTFTSPIPPKPGALPVFPFSPPSPTNYRTLTILLAFLDRVPQLILLDVRALRWSKWSLAIGASSSARIYSASTTDTGNLPRVCVLPCRLVRCRPPRRRRAGRRHCAREAHEVAIVASMDQTTQTWLFVRKAQV